jgi:iron complex transport system substrate-binding protein
LANKRRAAEALSHSPDSGVQPGSIAINIMKPINQPAFKRIVSLAPAITEILFALELADRLVGVTDSCDFPDAVRQYPNVSLWFEPDHAKLLALEPDLILGLETAHRRLKADMESNGVQVLLVNPTSVDAALEVILRFGELLDASEAAQVCVQNLQARLNNLDRKVAKLPAEKRLTVCRVLDLEDNTLMVAGPLSFQYDVIWRAGGLNVTGQLKDAYPKISWAQFQDWDPQMIFFCGHDRRFISRLKADSKWQTLSAIRTGRLCQFDCGLTCRTGPRIVDMTELLFDTLYGS